MKGVASCVACFAIVGASACADSTGGGGGTGGGTATGGDSSIGGSPEVPSGVQCEHVGSGEDYRVGPGQDYENLGDVPFETLKGGDTVRVFYKEGGYHEKVMLGGHSTSDEPIRMCGVPREDGALPIIDGKDATTRPELDFPFDGLQVRGVVILGHRHDDPYEEPPGPFVVESLAITGGDITNQFTDKFGTVTPYVDATAGIFVQRGTGVVIRGCEVYGNLNGLFIGSSGGDDATRDVLIESNYVHDNGSLETEYQHNVYNEAIGVTYQFNYFGAPRSGPDGVRGNNIKERSAGVVIRYNWIEDGAHLIDIVDAQEARDTTVPLPEFHETFVYGNVLYRPGLLGSMIHYGGDSGMTEDYRKGTLYSFQNTFVVDNTGQGTYELQALYELSTNEESLWSRNDVFFATQTPGPLSLTVLLGGRDGATYGHADVANDWIAPGLSPWQNAVDWPTEFAGQVDGFEPMPPGSAPIFADMETFRPAAGSALIGAGLSRDQLPDRAEFEYLDFARGAERKDDPPTIGAFSAE